MTLGQNRTTRFSRENLSIPLRDEAWASPLEGMDYYSDDYPDTPLEEFVALYERLTKYAKREIHDLAQSLATSGCVAERSSPKPQD